MRVGAESGHRNLRGVWRRLAVRAREAELHHVADVLDELLDELARYEARSQEFLRPPQHTTSSGIVVLGVGIISVVVSASVSWLAARIMTSPTMTMSRGISGVGVDGDLA